MSKKHWWLCIVAAANVCKISLATGCQPATISLPFGRLSNEIFIRVAAGRVHKLAAKQQDNGGRLVAAVACYLLVTGCRISIFKD